MLKYFFSIGALLLFSGILFAQSERVKGLRLGVDISRFALPYIQAEHEGYEVSADFEIKRDIYLAGEYGVESINLEKETHNYISDGYYFRAGFDKNFMKSEDPSEYEMVFGGLRYGFASQTHSGNTIIIYDPYWVSESSANLSDAACQTHWIEIVGGIKVELFRNFFMGWSVRGRIRLAHSGYSIMEPYNVPGYGNGAKKSNLGLNFSLYYRIPLYKQTVDYKQTED